MTNQPPAGDAELDNKFDAIMLKYMHGSGWNGHVEAEVYQCTKKEIMQAIEAREQAQREALAIEERIKENQLYLTEKNRHYYPASPIDPYIPLVQFAERISELQLKLKHLKDPERS